MDLVRIYLFQEEFFLSLTISLKLIPFNEKVPQDSFILLECLFVALWNFLKYLENRISCIRENFRSIFWKIFNKISIKSLSEQSSNFKLRISQKFENVLRIFLNKFSKTLFLRKDVSGNFLNFSEFCTRYFWSVSWNISAYFKAFEKNFKFFWNHKRPLHSSTKALQMQLRKLEYLTWWFFQSSFVSPNDRWLLEKFSSIILKKFSEHRKNLEIYKFYNINST